MASGHFLRKGFYGFFFFCYEFFSLFSQQTGHPILLKILFALKLPFHSFLLVKKGTLKTNQEGKYFVFSHCCLPFSIFFFKHNYQKKKKMVGGILPIQMKRKNNSKNFKPGLLHLKDTHRVFVPCISGS